MQPNGQGLFIVHIIFFLEWPDKPCGLDDYFSKKLKCINYVDQF